MKDTTLRAQLETVIKLNEELARMNSKLTSDISALVDAAQTVREDRDRLAQNEREQRKRVEELEAINKQLTNMLWGRRSERRQFDPNQSRLFPDGPVEGESEEVIADERAQEVIDEELLRQWALRRLKRKKKRASGSSDAFPDHFERRERLLDLEDEEKVGLKHIGDVITERMRFERPQVYIERIIRRKYAVEGQPEQGIKAVPAPAGSKTECP